MGDSRKLSARCARKRRVESYVWVGDSRGRKGRKNPGSKSASLPVKAGFNQEESHLLCGRCREQCAMPARQGSSPVLNKQEGHAGGVGRLQEDWTVAEAEACGTEGSCKGIPYNSSTCQTPQIGTRAALSTQREEHVDQCLACLSSKSHLLLILVVRQACHPVRQACHPCTVCMHLQPDAPHHNSPRLGSSA